MIAISSPQIYRFKFPSAMAATGPEHFNLFPLLPTEIRVHIWQEACHERVVEVMYIPELDKVITTTDPPAVLHVNRESRAKALKIYHKIFKTQTCEAQIYFCPWRDTLYLPRHRDMGYDDAARDIGACVISTGDVSSLAIDHVRPDIIRPWEPYNKLWLIQSFPQLSEVVLVIGTDSEIRRDHAKAEIDLIDPRSDPASILRLLDNVKESFIHEAVFGRFDPEESPLIPCPLVAKSKAIRFTRDRGRLLA